VVPLTSTYFIGRYKSSEIS